MKFYSKLFPNLTVVIGEYKIKFKTGIYETSDAKEAGVLKDAGFDWANDIVEEVPSLASGKDEVQEPFKVPKRWSMNKILEFAKEQDIEIPEGLKKAEVIIIVEEALAK